MAMTSTGGGEGLSSDINVTPLIDVLLVLLIIFMITQPLSRKAFDVQVPPEQATKQKSQPSSQIVLELRSDGSYAINGQPYALNQLEQAFHQIYDVRRPVARRRLGGGAALSLLVHAGVIALLVLRGRELLQRAGGGAPGERGGGAAAGGRPPVNFFTLPPAAAPAAVAVPEAPRVS